MTKLAIFKKVKRLDTFKHNPAQNKLLFKNGDEYVVPNIFTVSSAVDIVLKNEVEF